MYENLTYFVVFKAMESACSGIPYTCSKPGKEMSIPIDEGPENMKFVIQFTCTVQMKDEHISLPCWHLNISVVFFLIKRG